MQTMQNNRNQCSTAAMPVESKKPLVHICLNDIDYTIGNLSDTLTKLHDKLSPIMQPPMPATADEKNETCGVEIPKRLQNQNDMLKHINLALLNILDRLEV